MAKATWGEAVDAVQQEIAYGVLVYPFEVIGEMLRDAFTFGGDSKNDQQDDVHYHSYPCRDEDCPRR
jgi:hypothetical protein